MIEQKEENKLLSKNKKKFTNPLINSFFESEENWDLLIRLKENPTKENREKLNESFKRHYFEIRFTSYLSQCIHFYAINYKNKQNKNSFRNLLTIDKTDENGVENKEKIADTIIVTEEVNLGDDVSNYIQNEKLYKLINALSIKQKEIINLRFLKGLNDTEIASKLGVSQQAVSKLRKKTLTSLRKAMEKGVS